MSPSDAGRDLTSILTPALVLDRGRLEKNAARMRRRAAYLGVRLRPHLKTTKCRQAADILIGDGPRDITVSTLAEASWFLDRPDADVVYAVGLSGSKLDMAAACAAGRPGRLTIILDDAETARAMAAHPGAKAANLGVLIEVDSDGSRAGIEPHDGSHLREIADLLRAGGIELRGVLTHAGASYGCRDIDGFEAMAEQERLAVTGAAAVLRAAGHACPVVSVGSTPTASFARHLDGVTEVRSGVYAFYDLFQAGIGVCADDDIALSVLATVISRSTSRSRVLVDAGFLALSRDRSTAVLDPDWGYGRVCDLAGQPIGDLMIIKTNQEHGEVGSRAGGSDPFALQLDQRIRILPNHACATAAGHAAYEVVMDNRIVDSWSRINGWAP